MNQPTSQATDRASTEQRPNKAAGAGSAAGWSLGAALGAAFAASACCLGPLLLAAAGVGGAAAFEGLSSYRPLFLGISVVAVIGAFYFAYRKPVCADGSCAVPSARRRAARLSVWLLAGLSLVMASWPWLAGRLWAPAEAEAATIAGAATVVLPVSGLDCEACVVPIRKALDEAGGVLAVSLDLEAQTVTVRYDSARGSTRAYAAAIEELGFELRTP